jgi:hypothetical protein
MAARRTTHGLERPGVVHDDLPRLLLGTRTAHPREGARRRHAFRHEVRRRARALNGQIFFPEGVSTKAYATAPYTGDTNARTHRASDRVYTSQGGSASVLEISGGSIDSRLVGRITLGVDSGKNCQTPNAHA